MMIFLGDQGQSSFGSHARTVDVLIVSLSNGYLWWWVEKPCGAMFFFGSTPS